MRRSVIGGKTVGGDLNSGDHMSSRHQNEPDPTPALNHWFPLISQQLRFRSISHVYLYHPSCQRKDTASEEDIEEDEDAEYFLTFHETALSSPFLTSRPARRQENRLAWPEIDRPQHMVEGGLKACVVRLWIGNSDNFGMSRIHTTWGIYFSGLICLGDNLMRSLVHQLLPNTIVFKIAGHFFLSRDSLSATVQLPPWRRFLHVPKLKEDDGKLSYHRVKLSRMQRTLRAWKHVSDTNLNVKKDILARGLDPECSDVSLASQNITSIRLQIFTKQNKLPSTKKKEIALWKEIRDLQIQLDLVKEEKQYLEASLNGKQNLLVDNQHQSDRLITLLTERLHNLSKDKEKLNEWLEISKQCNSQHEKNKSENEIRQKQLITQLSEVFPINDSNTPHPTIGYVCLPPADSLRDKDDTELAVALGWTAHLTSIIAYILEIPLRYPILHMGSRSVIVDNILDKIPDREREFPLYPKGVDKMRFEYAVYLLNKNVAQLRWYFEEPTTDLRPTLSNIATLMEHLTTVVKGVEHELHGSASGPRLVLSVAPPILAGVAPTNMRKTPPTLSPAHPPLAAVTKTRSSSESSTEGSSSSVASGTVSENVDLAVEKGTVTNDSQSDDDREENEAGVTGNGNYPSTASTVSLGASSDASAVKQSYVGQLLDGPEVGSSSNNGLVVMSESSDVKVKVATNGAGASAQSHLPAATSRGEDVEVGVAAETFWDSVANRAQVLALPASFKTSRKSFNQL